MYLLELFKKPDGLVKDAVHVPIAGSRLQINICTWTLGVGGVDFLLSRSHTPTWDMAHMSSWPFRLLLPRGLPFPLLTEAQAAWR